MHIGKHDEVPWKDRDRLEQLYVKDAIDISQIADELGCSDSAIRDWRDKFGLERPWKNEQILYELRVEKMLTYGEIADRLGTTEHYVKTWTKKYDIKRPWKDKPILQEHYFEKELSTVKLAKKWHTTPGNISTWLRKFKLDVPKKRHNRLPSYPELADREALYGLYVGEGLSSREVAQVVGAPGKDIVLYWLEKHDIERWSLADYPDTSWTRTTPVSNVIGKIRTILGDEYWHNQRIRIIADAGDKCENCGDEQHECDLALEAHHIVPLISGGTNSDVLLMSLCKSCHRRAEAFIRHFVDPILIPPTVG